MALQAKPEYEAALAQNYGHLSTRELARQAVDTTRLIINFFSKDSSSIKGDRTALKLAKDSMLLALLLRRAANPGSVLVTLRTYPGEESHPFSQARVQFDFPLLEDGGNVGVYSSLDLIGKAGKLDSTQVLGLIGNPDRITVEPAESYVLRLHNEIRNAERRFTASLAAINSGTNVEAETETNQYLSYLKDRLVKKVLEIRGRIPEDRRPNVLEIGLLPGETRIIIIYGDPNYGDLTHITLTSELADLINKTGGG